MWEISNSSDHQYSHYRSSSDLQIKLFLRSSKCRNYECNDDGGLGGEERVVKEAKTSFISTILLFNL